MSTIVFDFNKIHSYKSFYAACKDQLQLPEYFGNNLDALWDSITTEVAMPLTIQCIHLTPYHQQKFSKLFGLFKDAENELDGLFKFETGTTEEQDAG